MPRNRSLAASFALLVALSAGCDDARVGGEKGVRTPGDSPSTGSQQVDPSKPEVGSAVKDAGAGK
jgi:hypothetical protein